MTLNSTILPIGMHTNLIVFSNIKICEPCFTLIVLLMYINTSKEQKWKSENFISSYFCCLFANKVSSNFLFSIKSRCHKKYSNHRIDFLFRLFLVNILSRILKKTIGVLLAIFLFYLYICNISFVCLFWRPYC